jgi:protein phosphatase
MGTTIVIMACLQEEVHIMHVGDSRAYLLSLGAKLKGLTTDHSMVEELIKCGRLTREEAKDFPNRNIILRALGAGGEPDYTSFPPQAGDVVLLCTDGLCGVVPDGKIAAVLRDARADNLDEICQQLIKLALSNGGPDNIAVVVSIFV